MLVRQYYMQVVQERCTVRDAVYVAHTCNTRTTPLCLHIMHSIFILYPRKVQLLRKGAPAYAVKDRILTNFCFFFVLSQYHIRGYCWKGVHFYKHYYHVKYLVGTVWITGVLLHVYFIMFVDLFFSYSLMSHAHGKVYTTTYAYLVTYTQHVHTT